MYSPPIAGTAFWQGIGAFLGRIADHEQLMRDVAPGFAAGLGRGGLRALGSLRAGRALGGLRAGGALGSLRAGGALGSLRAG